ncbi:MAG: hypothetical protein ACLSXY_02995 [Veillonella sp.]
MREIQVSEITKTVRQMCMDAAYHLPKDIYEGLKKAVKQKNLSWLHRSRSNHQKCRNC